ncbi:RecQ family ATP-dependent DNA helicase [Gaetbulibacter aestuarii]|uniref:ATP-dependent DNA helicase RecQ n=1 Tax=Gaetbulibacter aestuarii TaxID=1502358 RepID=A0ABW7MZ19_9FLAO
MEHPVKLLERYWNYTEFRPLQEEIIEAVLSGEDTFALLPTGGGKSLCFQIPALAKPGICIVISPLIALMKDQVKALQNKGIKALALTSGIGTAELDTLLDNAIYGNYKFLYLSPERLQQELVQDRIKQMPVNLIAVDEAHCISQWGNDFRPAYKNILSLRQLHPAVNMVALTASAKPKVVDDIITALDFMNPKVFKSSFFRPNLAYMVFHEDDKLYRLETILNKNPESSIVYVRNRKSTLETSAFLNDKGLSATYYHGGLSSVEKDRNMQDWMQNRKQVMVATNAFGMGIDKPDVKTVVHLNLPESIESYFQEAGRAGRNGKKAFAVILKNNSDPDLVENQFLKVLPDVKSVKFVYKKLCSYFQIPYGEGDYNTFNFDFTSFCKTYKLNTLLTYNALLVLDRNSVISLSRQFKNKVSLQFKIPNKVLLKYLENDGKKALIVKALLRLYGGVFDQETRINTNKVSDKAGVSEKEIIHILETLEKDDIIEFKHIKTDAQITFIEPREDRITINRIAEIIEQQNKVKQDQVHAMLEYIENENECKSVQLLRYFGEEKTEECGICSVCIERESQSKPSDLKHLQKEIVLLLEHSDLSSRAIISKLDAAENDTKQVLKFLLEKDIIKITKTNTYSLSHL